MIQNLPLGGSRPIPEGWRLFSLDGLKADEAHSCCAGPFGSSISSKFFVPEGIPVIRGSNLTDDLTRFVPSDFVFVSEHQAQTYRGARVHAGDLVFTCWGTIGQVGIIPENGPFPEYIISNKQLKLRINSELARPLFLFYYLSSREGVEHFKSRASGSAVPGLNLGVLKSIQVAVPDLETQDAILRVLTRYDDLIQNNLRRIELIEESARIIFIEWFTHLRYQGHEKVPVVNGVPEGWEYGPISKVVDFNPKTKISKHSPRPFVGMGALSTRSMVIDASEERVPGGGAKFRNHDTLLARITPCIENGKTGFVQFMSNDEETASGSTEFIVMRSISVNPYWVYLTARSNQFRQHAINSMSGADGRQRVNPDCFSKFNILIPPAEVLGHFAEVVAPMFRQIQVLHQSNRQLQAARDLLLPRIMSGSLEV